ncbi:NUMOD4 domain-containing protein [Cytobacillus horneckiae]|uniref:NUMOD4 domain-containing protein n=1 Tax=Cytobacillus horneckiae TaxID=549687 RepID=UPI003D2079C1
MIEVWKDIPGYEGEYQASNLGRVKSLPRLIKRKGVRGNQLRKGKVLSSCIDTRGYVSVKLYKGNRCKTINVHRLVCLAFIPSEDVGLHVNHKDGDRTNNNVENLEWCTRRENVLHAIKHNLKTYKTKAVNQYDLQGKFIRRYESIKEAAEETRISASNISAVISGNQGSAGDYLWEYATESRVLSNGN